MGLDGAPPRAGTTRRWRGRSGRDEGFLPGVDLRGRAYRAHGYRGQYVIVIPARNLVVVHLVDRWDPTEYVSFQQMGTLLSMILEAAPEQPRVRVGRDPGPAITQ